MKKQKKKHTITLLEIMIVIFLIGLIGSVIGYNVKGSMEEGKAFKTEQAAAQIKDILNLQASSGEDLEVIVDNVEYYLKSSGLCKDYKKLMKDGWGKPFEITLSRENIKVSSSNLSKHIAKKNKGRPSQAQQSEQTETEDDQE